MFDLRTVPSGGYNYAFVFHLALLFMPNALHSATGTILGYGLRNEVGLAEDAAGNILGVENSFDDAYRLVNGVRTDVSFSLNEISTFFI